jgi:hypothetical protein
LYAALTSQSIRTTEAVTDNDTIALFPQEWLRDPASPFLNSAHHDVPWKEPRLVQLSVRKLGKKHVPRNDQGQLGTVPSRSSQSYFPQPGIAKRTKYADE